MVSVTVMEIQTLRAWNYIWLFQPLNPCNEQHGIHKSWMTSHFASHTSTARQLLFLSLKHMDWWDGQREKWGVVQTYRRRSINSCMEWATEATKTCGFYFAFWFESESPTMAFTKCINLSVQMFLSYFIAVVVDCHSVFVCCPLGQGSLVKKILISILLYPW